MRPSKQKFNISFREFVKHCEKLKSDQETKIIKSIKLIPTASPDEINDFVNSNQIEGNITNIAKDFDFLPKEYSSILSSKSITSPTPIQKAIIPLILEGNDVIAVAETGSGKTLAYALPGVIHIQAQPQALGPRILVLAPTRELVQQIQTQYELFTRTCCVYGGVYKNLQYSELLGIKQSRNNISLPSVIIGTPGRLLDFMKDGYPLKSITQVVLDEADRMLDMGFEEQITQIFQKVRKERQTLFFSATWPKEVQKLANFLCNENPNLLQIGEQGLSVNKNIQQEIIIVYENKFEQFVELAERLKGQKLLIFCQKKIDTQKLEYRLSLHGLKARYLHGDLKQAERDYIMEDFKTGAINCLITTNLASRGLDISDVDVVINYDFPDNIEDYIHRIGRTGRAGKKGLAISFFEPGSINNRVKSELVQVLQQSNQVIPQELFNMMQ
ncbi:unnamed protein product (macronuclear) [Paramecium tetraurelia]|uniref:RNA helicase n=1 Tax=Paramecium tetraurelia TaxID=5888 RepID=A0CMG4_PARTE|nr:uncharacterized protein GSPATT00008460001 [Paramecium tetraurelia]CAK71981.1 unnamed protein product [Paramecium tetraurelia]|eukprot:XP_001439378.1 hypothetical protein (macronuclear) [Paramecium tetraurelia strain d4-2]